MNTLDRLNAVIDYVEKNMTEILDLNHLAGIACRSLYDFQRMFAFISEMSIMDYIRKRRLTLAGLDLKYNNAEIMDTAFKYGYDSPSSFARAFRAFHEVAPNEAKKSGVSLRIFPQLIFQISVKEVPQMIRTDKVSLNGKEYDASYFGEEDMKKWGDDYIKREFWRLENAYDDLKNNPQTKQTNIVHSYLRYPFTVELEQAFIIDYTKKDGSVERQYQLADGTMYEDTPVTRQYRGFCTRTDRLTVNGKEYDASYFGEQDMTSWTEDYLKREFWRLENAYDDFKDKIKTTSVIPYNNFPMNIEIGQVFVIVRTKKDGSVERRDYYRSDGVVWNGMTSTSEFFAEPADPIRVEKMTVDGKEYDASYFGGCGRDFWRLENAYDDFKDKQRTGDCLPYNNFPMLVEKGQVFVIQEKKEDGTVDSYYYISDGFIWKNMPSTNRIYLEPKKHERIEKRVICGKEYDASYLRSIDIPDWDFEKQLWGEIYKSFEVWQL